MVRSYRKKEADPAQIVPTDWIPASGYDRMYPAVGRDFSFSKIYLPGEYTVDTLTLFGPPSAYITPEVYKQVERREGPCMVEISAGTFTLLDTLFRVTVSC